MPVTPAPQHTRPERTGFMILIRPLGLVFPRPILEKNDRKEKQLKLNILVANYGQTVLFFFFFLATQIPKSSDPYPDSQAFPQIREPSALLCLN